MFYLRFRSSSTLFQLETDYQLDPNGGCLSDGLLKLVPQLTHQSGEKRWRRQRKQPGT